MSGTTTGLQTSAGARELLQRRMRQLASVIFVCAGSVWVFEVATNPGWAWSSPGIWVQGMFVALNGIWALLCVGPVRSYRFLRGLDISAMLLTSLLISVMPTMLPIDFGRAAEAGLIVDELGPFARLGPFGWQLQVALVDVSALGTTLMARAALIPSRRRHTLFVAVFAMLALPAMTVTGIPGWSPSTELHATLEPFTSTYVATIAFVLLAAVTLSSVAVTHVMHGLRREVHAAKRLGQYTLGAKIGAGGMGQVHRATHALLRRPAAIKLIREGEVNETAMRRFEREVQLTSELTHENTIAIYDYGHTPEGVFYYVMEYLDGLDLKDLVRRYGPQPPERVVHILRQACGALEEAHSRGLVHRDIKPANIVLCRRGDVPDVVKVLDFGLVKDLGAPDETRQNVIAGTPAYLSPEAIEDPETVGPASDLYALGAVAYFLITGEQLFEKKTLAAFCAAHLSERPMQPSQRLGAPVPEVLEELIMACLEKDPTHRPSSARELRRALELVEPDHDWSEDEARAWWTTHEAVEPEDVSNAANGAVPSSPDLSVTVDVRRRPALIDPAQDDVA